MKRHGYIIGGQVQGVGFRPFVYRAATRLRLTGHVGNTSDGVRVEVQRDAVQWITIRLIVRVMVSVKKVIRKRLR